MQAVAFEQWEHMAVAAVVPTEQQQLGRGALAGSILHRVPDCRCHQWQDIHSLATVAMAAMARSMGVPAEEQSCIPVATGSLTRTECLSAWQAATIIARLV